MLRSESAVFAEFAKDYDGPVVSKDGFDYVPWPQVVRILNDVVGPGNWNDKVTMTSYNHAKGIYTTAVDLSITVASDEDGSPKTISHYGVSTSVAQPSRTDKENGLEVASSLKTHETAIDGSASLARTKASKPFGNRFGLKMYKDAEELGESESSAARKQYAKPASNGNGGGGNGGGTWYDQPALQDVGVPKKGLSEAQINAAKKKGNLSDEDLENMTRRQVKDILDGKAGGSATSSRNAATAARTGTPDDFEAAQF